MLACHAGGPGSIPGRCILFHFIPSIAIRISAVVQHNFLSVFSLFIVVIIWPLCSRMDTDYPVVLLRPVNGRGTARRQVVQRDLCRESRRRRPQGRLRHINDGANAPCKKIGGRFLQELRGREVCKLFMHFPPKFTLH